MHIKIIFILNRNLESEAFNENIHLRLRISNTFNLFNPGFDGNRNRFPAPPTPVAEITICSSRAEDFPRGYQPDSK